MSVWVWKIVIMHNYIVWLENVTQVTILWILILGIDHVQVNCVTVTVAQLGNYLQSKLNALWPNVVRNFYKSLLATFLSKNFSILCKNSKKIHDWSLLTLLHVHILWTKKEVLVFMTYVIQSSSSFLLLGKTKVDTKMCCLHTTMKFFWWYHTV